MTRFISFLSLILLSFLYSSLQAQSPEAILEASKKKAESLQDLKANFVYSLSSSSLRPVSRKGKLYLKDGKYRITLGDIIIISDKSTRWQCLPEDGEVLVQSADEVEGPNPKEIFQLYQERGNSRLLGSRTINGVACHYLYLSLEKSNLDYNQAYLWIDKKTDLPVKVSLIDLKNTTITYELFEVQTDIGLQEKLFKYNSEDCPDCDMIDY